jgi:hypothetical protein
LREGTLGMGKHEDHSDLQQLDGRYDSEIFIVHIVFIIGIMRHLFWSPLKARFIAIDDTIEHIHGGPVNREVYASTNSGNEYFTDVDTSIKDPSLDDTSGVNEQGKIKGEMNDTMIYTSDVEVVIDNMCEEETDFFEDNMLGHNTIPSFFLEDFMVGYAHQFYFISHMHD